MTILRPLLQPVLRPIERNPLAPGLGGAAPTPATVFGSRLLYWNDPSDIGNTWQESTRTTGAAVGQPVGSRLNKGALGGYAVQALGASRPTLRLGSGYYDESDTVDDFLSIALNLSPYTALTVAVGIRKESDAAAQIAVEHSAVASANVGSFYVLINVGVPYAAGARGDAAFSANQQAGFAAGFAATNEAVLIAEHDIPGDLSTLVADASTGTPGTGDKGLGNFGNYTFYEMMRGGSGLPLVGGLFQRLIISGVVTAGEKAWLKTWMGAKQGKVL